MSRSMKSLATLVIVGLAAIGGLAWWLGYFSDPPEEASVGAAAEAAAVAASASSTTEPGSDPSVASAETTAPPLDSIDGTWTVTPNEAGTFAGYRIKEVLNSIGDFEVVGRTPDVTGTFVAQGTTIEAVDITVDMTTLTTDNSGRDRQMRSQALETTDFPVASFVLTEPIELDEIPAEGIAIAVVARGDLTIHGVTNAVAFPLDAQVQSGSIAIAGQLPIALADYSIEQPSAPIVASVEDTAVLELSLILGR